MNDIVDAITALVDEQLAHGPQDDYNVDRYPRCWHCGRQFHGLPVTERIAEMYAWRTYDESYVAAEDDSRVLCRGSNFIGPMPAERIYEFFWLENQLGWRIQMPEYREHFVDHRRWWKLNVPQDAVVSFETRTGGQATLTIGDETRTFPAAGACCYPFHPDIPIGELHVLAQYGPDIGGTWEPLTAPGVTTHPSRGLTQVGPNPDRPGIGIRADAPWSPFGRDLAAEGWVNVGTLRDPAETEGDQ